MQNGALEIRKSGLVTFKLFAYTYVMNVCIWYALFSIVGLDAMISLNSKRDHF